MTNATVQLSDQEIAALKARTGKRSAAAALKAWAARAIPIQRLVSTSKLQRPYFLSLGRRTPLHFQYPTSNLLPQSCNGH
jgi:hypothetical protein